MLHHFISLFKQAIKKAAPKCEVSDINANNSNMTVRRVTVRLEHVDAVPHSMFICFVSEKYGALCFVSIRFPLVTVKNPRIAAILVPDSKDGPLRKILLCNGRTSQVSSVGLLAGYMLHRFVSLFGQAIKKAGLYIGNFYTKTRLF